MSNAFLRDSAQTPLFTSGPRSLFGAILLPYAYASMRSTMKYTNCPAARMVTLTRSRNIFDSEEELNDNAEAPSDTRLRVVTQVVGFAN